MTAWLATSPAAAPPTPSATAASRGLANTLSSLLARRPGVAPRRRLQPTRPYPGTVAVPHLPPRPVGVSAPGSRRAGACPRPGGLSSDERAVERGDAVGEPAQARAAGRVGAADAVVGDLDGHAPVRPPDRHAWRASRARTWRRWRAPRRRRSRRRSRPAPGSRSRPSASTVTGTGARATSACSAGSSPRSVSTAGWMPRASSRSSARLVCSSSCARSSSAASSASPSARVARRAQQQRERDEPRLRAVVQVALEPPALGVAGLDEPRARGAQLLQARAQLGVELRDVAAQQAAEERERQQRGRDERGPPGGVAGAGARRSSRAGT